VSAPVLRGERVLLRPLEPGDKPILKALRQDPSVAEWWGALEEGFPFGDYPEATRFAIVVDGEVAGLIQYAEEADPDSRHAEIDLFLGPGHQGAGYGPEAMATLARHLLEDRGHHRLMLSAAVGNDRAIRAYEKVGFRAVGVTHASWRDGRGVWRDEVLMERVVHP
jgi:aminoglycoside 6'-N-acetyltransferase